MSLIEFSVISPKISPNQLLQAIESVIPTEKITEAISLSNSLEKRERRLTTHLIVVLVIAMSFWSTEGIIDVFKNLVAGLSDGRIVQMAIPQFQTIKDNENHLFFSWLIAEMISEIIPPRQNRSNPRVVKKTRCKFKKTQPIHRGNGSNYLPLTFQTVRTVA